MRKTIEPRQPILFKSNNPRIAILKIGDGKSRSTQYTYGLDAVVEELSVNITKIVTPETIDDCDICLFSACSPADILNLISSVGDRPRSDLIVGGQGVYSFLSWRHIAARIAFGRTEHAVDDCVIGYRSLPWCYDYADDRNVTKKYIIRQARSILHGESSVGCDGACKFCQYRATRSLFGDKYSGKGRGQRIVEDRWEDIVPRTGNQTTALDGWSEKTRYMVGKPVTDEQIIEKLSEIVQSIDGVMRLKVFQIVGYPWETRETLLSDLAVFRDVLSRVRPGDGRIMMMITVTPFSPEPLTAMEDCAANIKDKWRDILLSDDWRCIVDMPHLNAFILPQIPGPLTLFKRVAVNRITDINKLRLVAAANTIDDAVSAAGSIHLEGMGLGLSKILRKEQSTP